MTTQHNQQVVPVKDCQGIVKDTKTAAVLAADVSAYQSHLARKQQAADFKHRLSKLENDVSVMNSKLDAVLSLLLRKDQ